MWLATVGTVWPLYNTCVSQVEAAMGSALQGLRSELLVWAKDEVLWKQTWATLLSQVEGL